MSARVFVSHSSADQPTAHKLVAAIEADGVLCWVAGRDIAAGANFQEEIVRAIHTASAMVLIFSENANQSGEMKKELAVASQCGLAVIPVRIDDAKPDDAFAYELATRQWIDVGRDEPHAVERLVSRLRSLGGPPDAATTAATRTWSRSDQKVTFCRTPDGARLALARVGSGPPLIRAASWMSHLDYEWDSPIWGHVIRGLASRHTLIRYDGRGTGLSDWEVDTISLDAWVDDLEAVVDATGLERFALLGMSLGTNISIAYAVRHPERVSRLILYGSGPSRAPSVSELSPSEREKAQAFKTLVRTGWGDESPVFRQLFTSRFIPGGTKEQYDWYNELQRKTASPDCAYRYVEAMSRVDTSALLAKVTTPTLIMHARGDMIASIENSRTLAREIPGARFVVLHGQNHLFLEHEPATERFFNELDLFLKPGTGGDAARNGVP